MKNVLPLQNKEDFKTTFLQNENVFLIDLLLLGSLDRPKPEKTPMTS